MKDTDTSDLSWDDWDELHDPRADTHDFDRIVDEAISRRGFLGGALAFGSGAAVMGTGSLLSSTSAQAATSGMGRFAFKAIPIATDNTVHVPEGYSWDTLVRWGDPLFSDAPDLDHATGGDVVSADRIFGENTDGMELFEVDGHEVIAVNHEYVNTKTNLPQNEEGKPASAADVEKLQKLQGVAVFEVARGADGKFAVVVDSKFNRRITHQTEMELTGPRSRARPFENGRRSVRHQGAWHFQQLRRGQNALGHVSDLRREL